MSGGSVSPGLSSPGTCSVLNGYLILNIFIPVYMLVKLYYEKEPNRKLVIPLILVSIPWAVGIHTVTAFLYNGLEARPFWNASILAPGSWRQPSARARPW